MNKLKIILYGNSNTLLKKLIKYKIYYNLSFIKNDYIVIYVDDINYKKINKYFKKYEIVNYYGLKRLKLLIKNNNIVIFSVVFSLIIIYIASNLIFNVKIETNNKYIKTSIKKELEKQGINKYHFKKSYSALDKIKKQMLVKYSDNIEWIEIEEKGTTYYIKLTERKKEKFKKEDEIRDIVSDKDGIIRKIVYTNGVLLKDVGDYVKKGEVIITGNIIKGEDDLKDQVSATGKVFAEVWYIVNTSVPYNYKYLKKEKKFNRYYIKFFGKEITIINYYNDKNVKTNKTKIIDKLYLPFNVYKEEVIKYDYKVKKISEKEAYDIALSKSVNKIKLKLKSDEYIISKKVLKKEPFRSKINLEVFVKCYEDVTKTSKLNKLERGSVKSDT